MRVGLALGLIVVGVAGGFFLWRAYWINPSLAGVKGVPAGHQEVAWISPATSNDAWERLVAALRQLEKDWAATHGGPALRVNLNQAFLDLTADVPEIGLSFAGSEHQVLWIRWYKLSGEIDGGQWINKLKKRGPAPLAIIGGETTDRALSLARVLQAERSSWPQAAPLFLITTATAERYFPKDQPQAELDHERWPKLMDAYDQRSFRFSFTNPRMVAAVMDFLQDNPQVWAYRNDDPTLFAGMVAPACPWTSLGLLGAGGYLQSPYLFALDWLDDGYSKDLAEIFLKVFASRDPQAPVRAEHNHVPYGVGDYYQPNPGEQLAVDLYLDNTARFRDQPQLLVLPTGTQRARRFLRTLCRRAPQEIRKVVVATGDAITFNTIYRDRDVAWNIQDMPVPLVFFSHRNPIDPAAGFGQFDPVLKQTMLTGTQDLLLHRDLVEAVLLSAFKDGVLQTGADQMEASLRELKWSNEGRIRRLDGSDARGFVRGPWRFFDAEGNREPGTGEYVVLLQPAIEGDRVLARATISVWQWEGKGDRPTWRLIGEPLRVQYDRPSDDPAMRGP